MKPIKIWMEKDLTKLRQEEELLSRMVIRDIVIPIVEKITQQGFHDGFQRRIIQDPNLEDFLEEEMRRRFGVIGANECQHLREQLEEAKKNDPFAFEFLISQLLERYVRLAVKIRSAKKLKEPEKGPPDRFSELLRRKYTPYHHH